MIKGFVSYPFEQYPNPFVDQFTVDVGISGVENFQPSIFTITGAEINNVPTVMEINGSTQRFHVYGS